MFLGFQNFCHHVSVIPFFFIAAKNCDILIHEASYEDIYANRRSNNMHRYAILFMYCTGCYAMFTYVHRVLMNRSTCSLLYIQFAWDPNKFIDEFHAYHITLSFILCKYSMNENTTNYDIIE